MEEKEKKCCEEECNCKESEEKQVEEPTETKQEDILTTLKKLQAEFDNYRKQQEKQKQQTREIMKKDLLLKIIPIVDLFDLAIKHKENTEEFIKGMEMIHVMLNELLTKEGVSEITDKKFNPELHEAIQTEDGEEGKVLEVLQKGYKLDNMIIRPARVKVGNGGKNE